jgi:DNA polymerase (family 10)
LPQLIAEEALRGDLQSHTTASDGKGSLEEMVEAAEALGHEYLAVTDHTPSLRMVRGLDLPGLRRQMRRIDRLNAGARRLTLLKGAEVDIHPDGSLDLPPNDLMSLDIVLVAIHSALDLPKEEQTRRVVRGICQPCVDVLAHPAGRLIGRRAGVSVDWDEIFRAAADHGVMLEIDAQPERLDLDDILARKAIASGVTLTIGSDAHAPAELGYLRWGVSQARRAWARKTDVANTRPLTRLLKLLHDSRR